MKKEDGMSREKKKAELEAAFLAAEAAFETAKASFDAAYEAKRVAWETYTSLFRKNG